VPAAQPPFSVIVVGLLAVDWVFGWGAGLRAGMGAVVEVMLGNLGFDAGADFAWLKVDAVGVLTFKGTVGWISLSIDWGEVVVFGFCDKA
jgi:hypothetical protein